MRQSNITDSTGASGIRFEELVPVEPGADDILGEIEKSFSASSSVDKSRLRELRARKLKKLEEERRQMIEDAVAAATQATESRLKREAAEQMRAREAEWEARTKQAYDQGVQDSQALAAEKLPPLIAALESAANELQSLRSSLADDAEELVIEMTLKLAQAVMKTQPLVDPAVLQAALKEAITRTTPEQVLRVRVNPDDFEAAAKFGINLRKEGFEVIADDAVGRGGCVLETNLGEIRSTLEYRWQAAECLLHDVLASEKQHDDSSQSA